MNLTACTSDGRLVLIKGYVANTEAMLYDLVLIYKSTMPDFMMAQISMSQFTSYNLGSFNTENVCSTFLDSEGTAKNASYIIKFAKQNSAGPWSYSEPYTVTATDSGTSSCSCPPKATSTFWTEPNQAGFTPTTKVSLYIQSGAGFRNDLYTIKNSDGTIIAEHPDMIDVCRNSNLLVNFLRFTPSVNLTGFNIIGYTYELYDPDTLESLGTLFNINENTILKDETNLLPSLYRKSNSQNSISTRYYIRQKKSSIELYPDFQSVTEPPYGTYCSIKPYNLGLRSDPNLYAANYFVIRVGVLFKYGTSLNPQTKYIYSSKYKIILDKYNNLISGREISDTVTPPSTPTIISPPSLSLVVKSVISSNLFYPSITTNKCSSRLYSGLEFLPSYVNDNGAYILSDFYTYDFFDPITGKLVNTISTNSLNGSYLEERFFISNGSSISVNVNTRKYQPSAISQPTTTLVTYPPVNFDTCLADTLRLASSTTTSFIVRVSTNIVYRYGTGTVVTVYSNKYKYEDNRLIDLGPEPSSTPAPTPTITPTPSNMPGYADKNYWRSTPQKLSKVAYHKSATIIGIHDGNIYKSIDGALTWSNINVDTNVISDNLLLSDFIVKDICCSDNLNQIYVTVSANSWNIQETSLVNGVVQRPLIGTIGLLLKSSDGGTSWTVLNDLPYNNLWESPTGSGGTSSNRSMIFNRCSCSYDGKTIALTITTNKTNYIDTDEIYNFLLVSSDGGSSFVIKDKQPFRAGGNFKLKEYGEMIVSETGNRLIVQEVNVPSSLYDYNNLNPIRITIYDLTTNVKRFFPHLVTCISNRYAKIACSSDANIIAYIINYNRKISGNNPTYLTGTGNIYNKIAISTDGGVSWRISRDVVNRPNGIACSSDGKKIVYYEAINAVSTGSEPYAYVMKGSISENFGYSWIPNIDNTFLQIYYDNKNIDNPSIEISDTYLKQLSFNTNDLRLDAIDGSDIFYISSLQAQPSAPFTPTPTPTVTRTRLPGSQTPTPTKTPTKTPTVTPTSTKIIGNTTGTSRNSANYGGTSSWNIYNGSVKLKTTYLTTVGTNGGPSYYGTYDQTGMLDELLSLDIENLYSQYSYAVGGNYSSLLESVYFFNKFDQLSMTVGLRLCSLNNPLNLDMVTIGDIANPPDTRPLSYNQFWTTNEIVPSTKEVGRVDYQYFIGTYLITNCEYADFLNSVVKYDPYGIWNNNADGHIGIERTKLSDGTYSYTVLGNMNDKPINGITIYSAVRYCNWLHNGRPISNDPPSSLTTEDGVYTIDTSSYNGPYVPKILWQIITKKPDVNTYYIPNLDEWYKAAYYNPLTNNNRRYWKYATQSNSIPSSVYASSNGNGPYRFRLGANNNPIGFNPNESCKFGPQKTPTPTKTPAPTVTPTRTPTSTKRITVKTPLANFNKCANWNGSIDGNLTSVGSNGPRSYYGTADQAGQVWEWSETTGLDTNRLQVFGGSYKTEDILYMDISNLLNTINIGYNPNTSSEEIGFRIASKEIVPFGPEFVTVGDINNSPYVSPFGGTQRIGSVAYIYKIAKYPITNCQYADFLNNVARFTDSDNYGLYDQRMATEIVGGIVRINYQLPNIPYTYYVKPNMGSKPVVFVNWFAAARYCNWLHNQQPTGPINNGTTEDGAYSLFGATSGRFNKNENAKYYIPNIHEWYKAGHYDPRQKKYWTYPMPFIDAGVLECNTANINGNGNHVTEYICNPPSPPITPTPTKTNVPPWQQTPTPTKTITPTITKTVSTTPTRTVTPTRTRPTPTPTVTVTKTVTTTITPTRTVAFSPTPTKSTAITPTPTRTKAPMVTPTVTPTRKLPWEITPTPTKTPTPTRP